MEDIHTTYRFCPCCGGPLLSKQIKPGEPKRLVCVRCDFIFYLDPKIAACSIVEIDGKIVLLQRGIHPEYGKWVIPGGFVDLGEPVSVAAVRETWEEVRLKVEIVDLVGVYSYPHMPVVVIVYETAVRGGSVQAGDESLAAGLFAPGEIPWQQLAFSSTRDALRDYLKKHHSRFASTGTQLR
ncbi:MAG: NUDIX hydrolase [Thermodesulfobacteriota bacterium]